MRARQIARWLVAAVGLGTAATVYFMIRPRPVATPPGAGGIAVDPAAMVQEIGSTMTRDKDGKRILLMEAKERKLYPDGRVVFEGARFEFSDGTVITGDRFEGSAAGEAGIPGIVRGTGNITFVGPEKVSLQAQEATINNDTGQTDMPGPVTFTKGRLKGSGTGGTYEQETGVFRLAADAKVSAAAAEGQAAIEASATTLTFNRATAAILLEGQSRIQNGADVMTADRSTLYLTESQDRFRLIELRGQSRVVPGPAGTTPDMQAADIDMAFHENAETLQRLVLTRDANLTIGQGDGRRAIAANTITADFAPDGRTMTALDARDRVRVRTPPSADTPERLTTAATLISSGEAGRGLTAAQFAGGVTFVETVAAARGRVAATRTATSQTLALKLGGQLDDVEEAVFRDNVTFKDAEVNAVGDIGTYRAARGQLVLEPTRGGKRMPHVERGDVTVDATEIIEIDLTTKDVHARGEVKTISKSQGSGSTAKPAPRRDGALFNDRDQVLGFSSEFWFEGGSKRARYRGRPGAVATLRQGEAQVSGQSIEVVDETRDLTARGEVTTIMVLEAGEGQAGGAARYRVTADALDYKEQTRKATFTGTKDVRVVMTGDDGTTTADGIVMTLAQERRTLEQLDAKSQVHISMKIGHEGLADSLRYEAKTKRYTLMGIPGREPFLLRTKDEKPGSCEITRATLARWTQAAPSPEFPIGPENPGGTSSSKGVSCTGPLQR